MRWCLAVLINITNLSILCRPPCLLVNMFRVPGITRLQLTLKYLLLSTILYVSYCFLFNVPLASSSLPPYTGPYDVGTIDVEVPCTPRKTSDATFKATGLPAFQVCQEHAYASLCRHLGILTCNL